MIVFIVDDGTSHLKILFLVDHFAVFFSLRIIFALTVLWIPAN